MKQIVYEIVVYLHLMGYHDMKTTMLTDMYLNNITIEFNALIQILESIIEDMEKRNFNKSIISNVYDYIKIIEEESSY